MFELPGVSREIRSESPPKAPSNAPSLRLVTIDSLDGRTAAAREARAMRSAIIRDLTGGDDETALSALRLALVDSVAIATVIINDANVRWLKGEPVTLTEITTLSNARRRDAQLLGLDRVAKDVTDLDTWLSETARGAVR